MTENSFVNLCIYDTLEGLGKGLSRFSGPSRAALIYVVHPDDPMRIYDPQHLLRGHEPKFTELYIASNRWRQKTPGDLARRQYGHIFRERNLGLAGLISFGARSGSIYYQMWFSEHHPDMCSIGPTERWLEHAAWRLSHDLANKDALYTGISGTFLQEYATHAIRDFIVDRMNIQLGWDSPLRIYPILDAVVGISKTREEGKWPVGKITFVENLALSQIEFAARFPEMEQPDLENFKHVRKLLLSVEHTRRHLVSNGRSIIGISENCAPDFSITADFRGTYGFLTLNGEQICSFHDGSYHSSTRRAKLVEVEMALIESTMNRETAMTLFTIISEIAQSAVNRKHGCALVIDLNTPPVDISGQKMEPTLDLTQDNLLELAKSLAKVDGALHIGVDLKLHRFACLLDGHTISGEDRARGARFNSALRFTAQHDNLMVVVVSSDRPVSVIQEGLELNAQCRWNPISGSIVTPPRLTSWLKEESLAAG